MALFQKNWLLDHFQFFFFTGKKRLDLRIFTQIWTVLGIFLGIVVIILGIQISQHYYYINEMKKNLKEVEIITDSIKIKSKIVNGVWGNIKNTEQIINNLLNANIEFATGSWTYNASDTNSVKRSLANFDKVTKFAPYWLVGYEMKAYCLMYLEKYNDAINTANEALGLNTMDEDIDRSLKYAKAFAMLNRGLKNDKNNANLIFKNLLKQNKKDWVELSIYAVLNREKELINLLEDIIKKDEDIKSYIETHPEFKKYYKDEDFQKILKGN